MKPSQLICKNGVAYGDKHPDMTPTEHGFLAFLDYVDEEAERRAAFEADVLRRLAAVERKTSSTEPVEIQLSGRRDMVSGWTNYVTFCEPTVGYPPCVDGSTVHDMKGQESCPACSYTPRLAR